MKPDKNNREVRLTLFPRSPFMGIGEELGEGRGRPPALPSHDILTAPWSGPRRLCSP